MQHSDLAGKVAVVTGSGRGIGFAIAQRLAAEGCRIVLNDIDAANLAEAATHFTAEDVLAVPADISDKASVKALFAQAVERFGGVDILINNAALLGGRRWLPQVDPDYFDRVLQVNVRGSFLCARQAAVSMAKRGGGAIVNLSSVAGGRTFRANVPYVTSKGAVVALTQSLAMDLAPYRIRVNAIGPGQIRTPGGWARVSEEEIARRRRTVPLGREGFPEDIAGAAAFLVSADASYITGQTLFVDGGLLTPAYSTATEVPYLIGEPPATFELDED